MTWEIALGIFSMISAFVAVFNIVVRVNKTLCSLEVVVKQVKECLERQSEKNGLFFNRLSEHDIRLTRIEDKLELSAQPTWEEAWCQYFEKHWGKEKKANERRNEEKALQP